MVAAVLERVSTVGEEEDAHASHASHHTRSSSAHVPPHRSLQGVAACEVDTQELLTVVASSPGLVGTSFQGDLGVEGPRLWGSSWGSASERHHGPGLEKGVLR